MPVVLKDMASLPEIYPNIHEASVEEKFVMQHNHKSSASWHLIRANQEQSVKFLKGCSGTKGLCGK